MSYLSCGAVVFEPLQLLQVADTVINLAVQGALALILVLRAAWLTAVLRSGTALPAGVSRSGAWEGERAG